MITLLQIILHINNPNIPEVNIITHFKDKSTCQKKITATFSRSIKGGLDANIILSEEDTKVLLVSMPKKNKKSYWFCKETIFYK